ncbi:Cellulose synthase 6 [Hibiscus syriacus]|uniref:Cellulose synthase 6 n=1 Tax=Hibiscus syriacus TaxID=106335 RepID=A0A6A2ZDP3_HIBSY|nr:Cellulose synthase 6 [Hibiscus syriacus]
MNLAKATERKSSIDFAVMPDSDMEAAAQQLMQLGEEDNRNSSSGSNNDVEEAKINRKRCSEQSQDETTSAMIEEIFGKEEEIFRPTFKKRRRYRLLDSIYKDTKPLKVRYGKDSCKTT